jgi:hypothetical protein
MLRLAATFLLALSAPAAAAPVPAQDATFGTQTATTAYRNVFGWHVGDVEVQWDYVCVDCSCHFTGAPTVSETLPIQSCTIISVSSSPYACGATAACPDGVTGQKVTLVIECCAELDPFGLLCTSHQETLFACP